MTPVETELIVALYALYAWECVHWLAEDECGFTRGTGEAWKQHRVAKLSFTLLRRMPVLADPLLRRPGFVRRKTSEPLGKAHERALRRTAHKLDRMWLTDVQCRVQAMVLLLYVPAVVGLHRLAMMWPVLLAGLVTSHVLLMASYIAVLRRYRRGSVLSAAAPMLFNPLGATRAMEALSQVIYLRELKARKK